jgi:hypothetical protein
MAMSRAKTVQAYLKELPSDRREAISAVRSVIRKNLPKGYQETMNWGMIAYVIPLTRYPDTYNKLPLCYAALASQKNHMAVYLTCAYGDNDTNRWFRERFKASGKKLDMGKSCVRFHKLEDLPLEVIGEAIARVPVTDLIRFYEKSRKP